MADVVREILLCLFFAALLGGVFGWLARGLRARRMAAADAAVSRRALEELRAQLRVTDSARASDHRALEELQALAASARSQAETLRRELREAQMAREDAYHAATGAKEQLARLQTRLDETEAARDSAKGDADAARAAVTGARARVADLEDPRNAARREAEHLQTGQPSPLPADEASRQRLETIRATLKAAENGWDSARAQAEAALQQLGATRRQLAASEVDRNALAAQIAEVQAQLAEARATLEAGSAPVLQLDTPALSKRAEQKSSDGHRSGAERDNLQEIRGIGPVVERTLHRAGVYRYAQIAIWTHEDILSIGKRLRGFRDRIVRDRWTAAARKLHIAKYGSPP